MDGLALKCSDKDNVAVVFVENLEAGTVLTVRDRRGETVPVKVLEGIPYGHKTALVPIQKGQDIVKYGESIGIAVKDISVGEYVHVHNMESKRGRGDWED